MSAAIKIENVSKLYRLGTVGTGTLSHDLNRWWHSIRGKEDPYAKVGQVNDRTKAASDEKRETSEDTGDSSPLASRNSRLATSPDYVWALKDINIEVAQGEILGIIGRNGAGKSTLLKLLSRVTAPTKGAIKTKGRIASLLEVGTGFHPELTGRENIYLNGSILGMKRNEITKQLDEIVEFSGCARYVDTPTKRYSSGMKVRLGFAVAAHLACEILIVDEVLAVGDIQFQKQCIGKMQNVANSGRTVLFVTHNLSSIRSLCPRSVLLQNGATISDGTTEDVLQTYFQVGANQDGAESRFASSKHLPPSDAIVQRIAIVSETGQLRSEYSSTESFNIQFDLNISSGQQTHLNLGVDISDSYGTTVFRSYCNDYEEVFFSAGRHQISVNFPPHLLNGGQYKATPILSVRGVPSLIDEISPIIFSISLQMPNLSLKQRTRRGAVAPALRWHATPFSENA